MPFSVRETLLKKLGVFVLQASIAAEVGDGKRSHCHAGGLSAHVGNGQQLAQFKSRGVVWAPFEADQDEALSKMEMDHRTADYSANGTIEVMGGLVELAEFIATMQQQLRARAALPPQDAWRPSALPVCFRFFADIHHHPDAQPALFHGDVFAQPAAFHARAARIDRGRQSFHRWDGWLSCGARPAFA